METNDIKEKADKAYKFYEQLFDKLIEDAIDQGLRSEEIFCVSTRLFLDIAVTSRLSLDGVTDNNCHYAQNIREEFSKKLNSLLNEFLSKNNECRNYNKH